MNGRLSFVSSIILLACTAEAPADVRSEAKSPPQVPEVSTANPQTDPVEKPIEQPIAPVDGFFMAEGAPQPRACTVASDCLGDTIPDLENPCCNNPRTLEPYARKYREWVYEWRQDHCEAVTCPPPPPPSMPPECAFKVDCVEGRCVDSCN